MFEEYRLKARNIERRFQRAISKKGYFLTAKGNVNQLVEYRKQELFLKTEKGKGLIFIKRKTIRRAINYFF